MDSPDTTIVDLHRLVSSPSEIARLEGEAWLVDEETDEATPLRRGQEVKVGDTIALAPGAVVVVAGKILEGGRNGHAHAFVADSAFRSSPNRGDVPRLLDQLAEIERQMATKLGEDPLAMHDGPKTEVEQATSAEFARLNLDDQCEARLPELVARAAGAVCLFCCDESVFIAMSKVSIDKLRRLMSALGRPVNPHIVDEAVLDELLDRVYGRRRAAVSSPS